MTLAMKPVEFARYVFEGLYRGRHRLSWGRMEIVRLVWWLDRRSTVGEQAVAVLAALQPDSPVVRQWHAAEQELCPEEYAHQPIAPTGALPADPATRALALLTLAEPLATALRTELTEVKREISWRQRNQRPLLDLLERRNQAEAALRAWDGVMAGECKMTNDQ